MFSSKWRIIQPDLLIQSNPTQPTNQSTSLKISAQDLSLSLYLQKNQISESQNFNLQSVKLIENVWNR